MRDQTLLYWGMVVTIFIFIAAMLTIRQLIEMHFEKSRREEEDEEAGSEGPQGA